MLTIADRWRLSLPDSWLVPLDLPWDWDPCLRPCQSSSTPSPPNPCLTNWLAALPSPLSPSSNYKKMNLTLFWDLYLAQNDFPAGDRGPADASDCRCETPGARHLIIFCFHWLSVCVLVFLSVFKFVFVFTAVKYSAYTWSTSPMISGGLPRVLDHATWILRLHIPWVNRLFLFPHSSPPCPCWYPYPTWSASCSCWYPRLSASCSCWYIQPFCRDHPHHVGDISLSGAHLWNERRRWGTQWLLEVTDS